MRLLSILQEQKESQYKGGIYHLTQIKLAYNTNRIEGSQLTEEQTRYIFETHTLFTGEKETATRIDDILETVNHFSCFDFMLDIADEPLSEEQIQRFHLILKSKTSDARKSWFQVGAYKTQPNVVGGMETTLPAAVPQAMKTLLKTYHAQKNIQVEDVIDFHVSFEKIHPFQDGNGRVGRLIMFKECLKHDIVPFIIEDDYKFFYYRGLSEYSSVKEYLIDTCLSAQDNYKSMLNYFNVS